MNWVKGLGFEPRTFWLPGQYYNHAFTVSGRPGVRSVHSTISECINSMLMMIQSLLVLGSKQISVSFSESLFS